MQAVLDNEGSIEGLGRALVKVCAMESVRGVLVLACDANRFEPKTVDPVLQAAEVPIFGGVFPGIIYNGQSFDRGTLVVGLSVRPKVVLVQGLSDAESDFEQVLDENLDALSPAETVFVWVDGLSSRISALIEALFNVFGLEHNYIGGGAGSLSFARRPCLFTNDGMIQDAAVLAALEVHGGIGVNHGWSTLGGPYRVTEADRNVIKSLDWRPAYDVYRPIVEGHSGKRFTEDNFFALAKSHPFGLYRFGEEKVIRDPIVRSDAGALVCVGEVPEGAYVDIMTGTWESLVAAAKSARTQAGMASSIIDEARTLLFIDCVSRMLFLEENFPAELQAVYDGMTPMIGALTLGEIANSRQDYLEFYNKTAVVGILAL